MTSAVEAVEAAIQVAASVRDLNVFSHESFAEALIQAEASDERRARGALLGPGDGTLITIKDNIPVAGLPCEWGSRVFEGRIAASDELAVARLRAQGYVILGKTNVSEFTLGLGNVSTLLHGTTRNPHDPALTTGASTGGGAAAVAAGIGRIALGTDGGGSIRWPASYCGLIGLKPTVGRIPRLDGLPTILHDFEVIAPIGQTVEDVAMLLTALEGPDLRDRRSLAAFPDLDSSDRPLRIRYTPQFGDYPVEPEIAASVAEVAERFALMGHHVEEGPPPFDFAAFDEHWRTIGTAGLAWMLREHPGWEELVGDIYPPMVAHGESLSAVDYVAALDAFRANYAQLATFFQGADLLLTPVAGAMPWRAEELAPPYQRVFTGVANATGLPAISVPGPSQGMPIGFQLVGPFGADRLLLSVARSYGAAYPKRGSTA
ncbi:amidase [Herbidospora sp. RD11066]